MGGNGGDASRGRHEVHRTRAPLAAKEQGSRVTIGGKEKRGKGRKIHHVWSLAGRRTGVRDEVACTLRLSVPHSPLAWRRSRAYTLSGQKVQGHRQKNPANRQSQLSRTGDGVGAHWRQSAGRRKSGGAAGRKVRQEERRGHRRGARTRCRIEKQRQKELNSYEDESDLAVRRDKGKPLEGQRRGERACVCCGRGGGEGKQEEKRAVGADEDTAESRG